MSTESDNFEIMISRIYEILEREGATVEWNDRIPDPDNPNQLRQIDVIVRKENILILLNAGCIKVNKT